MARGALDIIRLATNVSAGQWKGCGVVAISAANALLTAGGYDRAETRRLRGTAGAGTAGVGVNHGNRVIVAQVSADVGNASRHHVPWGADEGPTCGGGGRVISTRAGKVPYRVERDCSVMAREAGQRGATRLARESI